MSTQAQHMVTEALYQLGFEADSDTAPPGSPSRLMAPKEKLLDLTGKTIVINSEGILTVE
ncbi:MAG: hypothetical protein WDZ51_01795 [Pirellulaceae bacterium]